MASQHVVAGRGDKIALRLLGKDGSRRLVTYGELSVRSNQFANVLAAEGIVVGENEVEEVTPIIHPPQVAILGLGAPHREPWAVDDTLAVRPVVHASLAADHRAIDGRIGSSYLIALRRHHALVEAAPDACCVRRRSGRVRPDLHDDLGLDSMDLLNFAAAISTTSGTEIPDRDFPGLRTLRQLENYLGQRIDNP